MPSVGMGVSEIRLRDEHNALRVIYIAKLKDAEDPADKQGRYRVGDETLPGITQRAEKMSTKRFTSVWDAIADTPEEAANMKVRSQLMAQLKTFIEQSGLSQSDVAKLFGITQPRVSDLMRGKIHLFAIDALVNMAAKAGLQIQLRLMEAA